VVDENGTFVQGVQTITDGEGVIAREFGISGAELDGLHAKRHNSKSFGAFASRDGKYREIISARPSDW